MGWNANALTGVIDTSTPPANITIPVGAGMTGKASTSLSVTGNLDANTAAGAANAVPVSTTVYDSQGNAIPVTLTFTKSGPNQWSAAATTTAAGVAVSGAGAIVFNGAGRVTSGGTQSLSLTYSPPNGSTSPQAVTLDLTQMTQLASTPSSLSSNTDGASAGTLTSFTVGQAGDITGVYSNGYKQPLGQMSLASFQNPSGLIKAGGNLFQASPNSGNANIGQPNSGGRGQIATGFLEGSNVDLAQQFTNMIMAQRGFQANSRVITTSDEILQDLVNIKH